MGREKVTYEYVVPQDRDVEEENGKISALLRPLVDMADKSDVGYYECYHSQGINYEKNPRKIVIESMVLTYDEIDSAVKQI